LFDVGGNVLVADSDYSVVFVQSDLMSVGPPVVRMAMKSLRWQASALSARSLSGSQHGDLMTARII